MYASKLLQPREKNKEFHETVKNSLELSVTVASDGWNNKAMVSLDVHKTIKYERINDDIHGALVKLSFFSEPIGNWRRSQLRS